MSARSTSYVFLFTAFICFIVGILSPKLPYSTIVIFIAFTFTGICLFFSHSYAYVHGENMSSERFFAELAKKCPHQTPPSRELITFKVPLEVTFSGNEHMTYVINEGTQDTAHDAVNP